jgi:hypothetical protein
MSFAMIENVVKSHVSDLNTMAAPQQRVRVRAAARISHGGRSDLHLRRRLGVALVSAGLRVMASGQPAQATHPHYRRLAAPGS